MRVLPNGTRIHPSYSSSMINNGLKEFAIDLFHSIDIPLIDIQTVQGVYSEPQTNSSKFEELPFDPEDSIFFCYKSKSGKQRRVILRNEGDGARILFGLFGPIFDVIDKGATLIIDEMNSSIHPNVLSQICEMFMDPNLNRRNGLLIFSSHDFFILNSNKFLRDQVWLMEMSDVLQSSLTPLSSFKIQEDGNFGSSYLAGEFGAIPITRRMKEAQNLADGRQSEDS